MACFSVDTVTPPLRCLLRHRRITVLKLCFTTFLGGKTIKERPLKASIPSALLIFTPLNGTRLLADAWTGYLEAHRPSELNGVFFWRAKKKTPFEKLSLLQTRFGFELKSTLLSRSVSHLLFFFSGQILASQHSVMFVHKHSFRRRRHLCRIGNPSKEECWVSASLVMLCYSC